MPDKHILTPDVLSQLLRYEAETGKLYWIPRSPEWFCASKSRSAVHMCANWNSRNAGKEALTAGNGSGYRHGMVLGRKIYAHRAIWVLAHGRWPTETIDHINGNRSDNRLCNLREATFQENSWNGSSRKGSSVYLGVSRNAGRGKAWQASIMIDGKSKHLGNFNTEIEAARAYDVAASKHFGEFARQNLEGSRA